MLNTTYDKEIVPNAHLEDIRNPERVRVLILTGQKLSYQQFVFLRAFTGLIKLDLSQNRISTFPQGFSFKPFTQLKTLFLHYNKIDRIKSIELLSDCNKLIYLTLFGNPIQESKVRHFCVNSIGSLKFMDDKVVNEEERFTGVLNLTQRLQPYARTGFPLIEMPNQQDDLQFLSSVVREISIAKNLYLRNNPIIVIQKWWKSKLSARKVYKKYLFQESIVKIESKNQRNSQEINQNKTKVNFNCIINNQSQKILTLFRTYFHGMRLLELLYNKYPSILCTKKYCLENNYKFKQFDHQFLTIYITPQNHSAYNLQREKQKAFHSLVFYNNSHYLLELNYKMSTNKKAQLKNIYGKQQTKLSQTSSQHQTNQFVQIDLPKCQKLKLIKMEYFKSKTSQNKQPFQLLFGLYVVKISSAVKIQKAWKGYLVRRSLNILRMIRQEKSARKIQKWLRNLKFYHRQKFLMKAYEFMKSNDSSNIVMTLEQFTRIRFYFKQKLDQFGKILKLPFQECEIEILQKTNSRQIVEKQQGLVNNNSGKSYEMKINIERQPFPNYFSKFIEDFTLSNQINKDKTDLKQRSLNIIDLLIKGATQIKKFQKSIVSKDNKKQQKIHIKFEYQNKNCANQRKLLLCLLTYNFGTQKWLQFHSQTTQAKINSVEVMGEIKRNKFIKIVADTDKKQNLFEKIKEYTKLINNQGVLNWYPVKIRYYEGTADYSAVLLCGVHRMKGNVDGEEKNEDVQNRNSYTQRKKLRQLRSLKAIHAKIALKNLDTHIILPTNHNFRQNENLMTFSVRLMDEQIDTNQQKIQQRYQQKQSHNYLSLNHDNSQFSINNSLTLTKNVQSSCGLSLPLTLRKNQDKNQTDSLTNSTDPRIQSKRTHISKTKQMHKSKLEAINEFKQKNQNSVRMQYRIQKQKNKQLIRQKSHTSLVENHNKVKKIQQTRKVQFKQSSQLQNFQNKFLRNGNLSIQNQLRQFQKNRSQSKEHSIDESKNKINQSARYGEKDSQRQNQKSAQTRKYLKKQVFKTQLKQFSINLSQSVVDLQNSLIMENEPKSPKSKANRREVLKSAVSQKITKLYEQKKKQFLKSEGKEESNQSRKHNSNFEQALKKIEDEKRKQMKKKRTVHSVFPEEFFPLKDSQQIGFHLPKINSYKE